ncbi:hypothetical protein, partial [Rhodopirellula bahusiensis]|uniref:hypothetical protein n=1 Tax=Rhodopirellula bahusiensis TaxID=2014065 RepID=UPI003263D933
MRLTPLVNPPVSLCIAGLPLTKRHVSKIPRLTSRSANSHSSKFFAVTAIATASSLQKSEKHLAKRKFGLYFCYI